MNINTFTFPVVQKDMGEDSQSVGEAFRKYLYRWPFFLISVAIALGLAYVYLKHAVPMYEINAKVLIKDEKQSNQNKESAMKEMDFFESNKVVENEIQILQSRKLMLQVVNDLNLWANYYFVNGEKLEDLYQKSPVAFNWVSDAPKTAVSKDIEIQILNDNQFKLISAPGRSSTASFGKNISGTSGVWQLSANSNIKDFIGKTIKISISDPNAAADSYGKRLSAETENKLTSVIGLKLKDNIPQRGEDILNRIIATYNSTTKNEKSQIAESTLHFIDPRIDSLTGQLNAVEKKVEDYRTSQSLTDIPSQSKLYLADLQTNTNRLNDINVQLNVLAGIERYVNSSDHLGTAPSTIGISDPTLIELINKLTQLQLQLEKLLATTTENNPIVIPVVRQIKITKAAIKENIKGIRSSLIASRNQYLKFTSSSQSSIKKLPTQERTLQDVKRKQDIKEELYMYLLKKREEISLSLASKAETAVVDPAYASAVPVSPKKSIIYGIALFMGLMLPAGFIYGKGLLLSNVTTRKEIERATSAPILSELVYEKIKSKNLIPDQLPGTIISEQFRLLRANLKYLHNGSSRGRVTLVTSSIANEGKSFITKNLGIALAASGRRTIILELDLRKPKIAESLHMANEQPGLTDYLIGNVQKEDLIQPTPASENLHLISAGCAISINPSELLESELIDQLFDWLKHDYDDILIDTPPVQLVADALVISRVADVSLYVVRQGLTYKSNVETIKQNRIQDLLPNMNIVFNAIRLKGKYDYGYDSRLHAGYYTPMPNNKSGKRFFTKLG